MSRNETILDPASLAREVIAADLSGETPPSLSWDVPLGGLAVTLHDGEGRIRGSMASTDPSMGSADLLRTLAMAVLRDDPRFPPVDQGEWERLSVSVWVLGGPRRVSDPTDIEEGDALFVRQGIFSCLFLPDLYVGDEWDPLSSLRQACRRAGLDAEEFRSEETEVLAFPAERHIAPPQTNDPG